MNKMSFGIRQLAAIILLAVSISIFALPNCSNSSQESNSGNLPTEKLQALLDKYVGSNGIPGMILALETQQGKWIGASGQANVATGEAMTPSMQVRIASITKPFTATLIMKLIEEGKLSLDDTVEKWLPGAIPAGSRITVRMLLNHTSGLTDHEDVQEFDEQNLANPEREWTSKEILAISNKYGLKFEPGEKYEYCNTGYYILGMIIEKVTNDTVENQMQQRFFKPLGMSRTSITGDGMMSEPFAHGHAWLPTTGKVIDNSDWNFSWDWTAGSCVTTGNDMLTWTKALFNGRVVNEETLRQMTTPIAPSTNYGFGLSSMFFPLFGERMIGHNGANTGTHAVWLYLPESNRTIFAEMNRLDVPSESGQSPVNVTKIMGDFLKELKVVLDDK